ncbi:MAG: MBL fold metallo-hydrolase [Pseudomonadota bacterium]
MNCRFWGTRGSIAVPGTDTTVYGGNTTCLEITLGSGRKVIVDAGTGIRALGEHLSSLSQRVDLHIIFTHIHWDHVLGFPFFRPIFEANSNIYIDGFPTCMKGLKAIFANKMGDGFFPVKFEDLKAQIEYLDALSHGSLDIDGTLIDTVPLQHPQGGYGFRFREGKKTLVFITDNELTEEAWKGRHPDDYVEFCKGADILIHDAQFTPEEVAEHRGWGHSDYVSAFGLAQKACVKRLVLFHHDPSRKDRELSSIEARCGDLALGNNSLIEVEAAREGTEISL